MYPYHNRIKQRINNGELVAIQESEDKRFAFVLIFKTAPFTRPIRPNSVYRYEDLLKQDILLKDFCTERADGIFSPKTKQGERNEKSITIKRKID